MLETWLSKERLLSNSTPRFLTDDKEFTEQPSSVRECSKLLHVGVLGPIIKTSVFSEFSSKKLLVIQFLYRLCILLVSQFLTPCLLMIFPNGNMESVKSNGPSTEP